MDSSFTPVDEVPEGYFRFIALDVETSCGDSASICQIGIACVGADNHIQTFATYINPQMHFEPFNIQLHGIDENVVSSAPTFAEFWHKLRPLLETNYLIQHSNFDKTAIEAACKAATLRSPDLNWSNSITIAKTAWPEFKANGGYGLARLKEELGLEFNHHDAGEDARAAALVVLHAERRMKKTFEKFVGTPRQIQLALPF
ncbi:MAG: 3'-5' exonuclease [Roseibium sp.]